MISATWVLVILLYGSQGSSLPAMTNLPDFATEEQCKLAGESWKTAATEAKQHAPRYICFVTETRME